MCTLLRTRIHMPPKLITHNCRESYSGATHLYACRPAIYTLAPAMADTRPPPVPFSPRTILRASSCSKVLWDELKPEHKKEMAALLPADS